MVSPEGFCSVCWYEHTCAELAFREELAWQSALPVFQSSPVTPELRPPSPFLVPVC